jgi:SAM-dependent methyltransferase
MTCPICGGPSKGFILRAEGKPDNEQWAGCDVCQLFFLREMPTTEHELQRYAVGDYRTWVAKTRYERTGVSFERTFLIELTTESMRAQHMIMTIAATGPIPKRFLDIGTATAVLPAAVGKTWKCETAGVEPYKDYVIFTGIPIFPSIDEVTGTYDVITCMHTLEHIPDPVGFLSKVREHLEPGGRLLIEVPNYYGGQNNPFHHNHVFVYTVKGLMVVLERAGLVPVTYTLHPWLFRWGTDANLLMVATHKEETE